MAMPGDKEGEHAVLPADKVLKLPSCAASALWRDRIILANELSMRKHIVERSLLAVAKEAVIHRANTCIRELQLKQSLRPHTNDAVAAIHSSIYERDFG